MLAIAEKKTDVLIKGDIRQLDKIVEKEEKLILNIGKQEDIRYEILIELERHQVLMLATPHFQSSRKVKSYS